MFKSAQNETSKYMKLIQMSAQNESNKKKQK